jgi:hypothetical protein
MRKRNRSEEGVTLVIVIFVGAIIMLMAFAIAMLGILETKSYAYVEQDTQAYYICKSAAEAMVAEIIDETADINNTAENLTLTTDEFDGVQGMTSANGTMNEGTYNVYASIGTDAEGNCTNIYIDSYATYADQEENLRLVYDVTTNTGSATNPSGLGEDVALFSIGGISLGSGGSTIIGDVGTNAYEDDSIEFSGNQWYTNSSVEGMITVHYPTGEDAPDVEEVIDCAYTAGFPETTTEEGLVEYEVIELPETPAYAVPEDDYFSNSGQYNTGNLASGIKDGVLRNGSGIDYTLDLESLGNNISLDEIYIQSGELTVIVGDEDCTITTEDFNTSGNGTLTIVGEGTLTIYVEDDFDLNAGGNLNYNEPLDPGQLTIYYKGSKDITFAGGVYFSGTFFTGDINKITMAGGSHFNGGIITQANSFKLAGGGQAMPLILYAPETELTIDAGTTLWGMAVVAETDLKNGSIRYSEDFVTDDLEASLAYIESIGNLIPANSGSTGETTYTFSNPIWEDNNP